MKIGTTTRLQELCPSVAAGLAEGDSRIPERPHVWDLFPGTYLHDSAVISVTRERHELRIVLDDIQTVDFACSVASYPAASARSPRTPFPIACIFRGIRHASLNRVNRNQKALPLAWERAAGHLRYYRYDEVIGRTDDLTELAIAFVADGNRNDLVLLVAAAEFLVDTAQIRASFEQAFGGRFGDLFTQYWNLRQSGGYAEPTRSRESAAPSHTFRA